MGHALGGQVTSASVCDLCMLVSINARPLIQGREMFLWESVVLRQSQQQSRLDVVTCRHPYWGKKDWRPASIVGWMAGFSELALAENKLGEGAAVA